MGRGNLKKVEEEEEEGEEEGEEEEEEDGLGEGRRNSSILKKLE